MINNLQNGDDFILIILNNAKLVLFHHRIKSLNFGHYIIYLVSQSSDVFILAVKYNVE